MNILILDDEKTVRKAMNFALRKNGHQISEANNPREALKSIASQHFDLIIMDLNLPIYSGLEFIKKLEERKKNIPIIILTSQTISSTDISAYKISSKQIISKESKLHDIVNTIEQFLKEQDV